MKRLYAVLAFVVCGLVAVQAAVAVWGESGMLLWVSRDGGVIDQATMEASGPPPFPEALGFMIHGMNGMMVIPLVALALLIIAFLAKLPRGVPWAVAVLLLVALQVALGIAGHSISIAGFAHGLNALVLFTAALLAGLGALRATRVTEPAVPVG